MQPLERKGPPRQADQEMSARHGNSNSAEELLSRLERVRETAAGQWLACCPAHEDRNPSLSIKRIDDRLLVHCFAGCSPCDVVAAVGLSLADLFNRPLSHKKPPLDAHERRRNGQAFEALQALQVEALVTLIAADRMGTGRRLGWRDTDRLHIAFERILEGCELVGAKYKDAKSPGHPPELKQPRGHVDEIARYNRRENRGEAPPT